MPLASYILSLCLHIALILLLWFWPNADPLVDLQKPVLISLVEGDPGGNKTPSPILGHMGEEQGKELAPTPPAEQAETAATAREEAPAQPVLAPKEEVPQVKEEPKKPEPRPKPKPEPKPEPKKEIVPPKKPEEKPKPKEEPKPKPKPKDAAKEQKKKEQDAIQQALSKARKATSRASSGDKGNSIERALAEARRNAGGTGGGGGGEGAGPGGGGLYNVYLGNVMLAVRPNWGYASASRSNLQCTVLIDVSASGEVTEARVTRSSGNAQYDASCVNAIRRTSDAGDFPPPPSPDFYHLEVVFTFNELMGR